MIVLTKLNGRNARVRAVEQIIVLLRLVGAGSPRRNKTIRQYQTANAVLGQREKSSTVDGKAVRLFAITGCQNRARDSFKGRTLWLLSMRRRRG
jgi:hypothetical protein